jgi:hypothetical protein
MQSQSSRPHGDLLEVATKPVQFRNSVASQFIQNSERLEVKFLNPKTIHRSNTQ